MDIKKKFRRGQIDISLEQVSSVKTNVPETHVAELFCNEACAESHNTCRDTQRWLTLLGLCLSPTPVLSRKRQQSFSPVYQRQQPYLSPLQPVQQQTLTTQQRAPFPLLYHWASCLWDNSRVVMLCSVQWCEKCWQEMEGLPCGEAADNPRTMLAMSMKGAVRSVKMTTTPLLFSASHALSLAKQGAHVLEGPHPMCRETR